jgi:CHAD domain-containing protein
MPFDVERIQKNVRALRKILKKAPKRMSPDGIHKLRTRTRRLESVLEALSRDLNAGERRLLRELTQIRRLTGKVRDMDVFSTHLATTKFKSDTQSLVLLFEYLGAKRYRHAGKLHDWMKWEGPSTRRRLKKMSSRWKSLVAKKDRAPISDTTLNADAMASALNLSAALATPPNLQPSNLHEYRMKIKDLRDVLQSVEHAENHNRFIEALGRSKDAIGEWHDWEELVRIAAKVLKREDNTRLLGELRKISQQRYEQALSVTNKMRDEYVQAGKRSAKGEQKRGRKASSPALQVVKAMTA